MKNLLNFKSGTAVFLFLIMSTFQIQASNFTMALVLGAANKLNNLQTDNIKFNSVDVMDVTNDLDPQHIPALNEVLMKVDSDNILNRLLRKAKLIGADKIVVGVLTTADGAVAIVLVAAKRMLK
jgi:hypothetical protein